jgi:AraC-like DNA-binding protein
MKELTVDNKIYCLTEIDELPSESNMMRLMDGSAQIVQGDFGSMVFQQWKAGDITVQLNQYGIKKDCVIRFYQRRAYLGVHLAIHSHFHYTVNRLGVIDYNEGQSNLVYLPVIDAQIPFEKGKSYASIDLTFKSVFLKPFIDLASSVAHFTAGIRNHSAGILYPKALNMPFDCLQIVKEILQADYPERVRARFVKIKAEEFLFHLLADSTKRPIQKLLKEERILQLREVKQFIEMHYQQHTSIVKLSKKAGMNTTTFKKSFKQEFGMTPFTFLTQVRLCKAIELLKNGILSVNQVADATGYQSTSSFIKAFKRYYQHTPGFVQNPKYVR